MMLRRAVMMALVGLPMVSASAFAEDTKTLKWTTQTYAQDQFRAEFPGPVKVVPDLTPDSKKSFIRATYYMSRHGAAEYDVGATLYLGGVTFDEGVRHGFAIFKCKTTAVDHAIPFRGKQARELIGKDCADNIPMVIARYYEIGKYFYQVLTTGGDQEAAERFVNSFEVLAQ
jgi:hypothetical protein